ncbi:MAG TPA: hypothetical protein VKU92_09060 [Acidimicrobiales bacterium]|nr:hypothetical protein [Acidimicrobiales bacterium]
MKLDELIALVRRSRGGRPSPLPTPEEVETIFTKAVALSRSAPQLDAAHAAGTGNVRPPGTRRLGPRGRHLPAVAGIAAVTLAVALALALGTGGAGPRAASSPGSRSSTTAAGPSGAAPERAICSGTVPGSPVMAYATYQSGDATSTTWLAAVALPAGRVEWRVPLPHDWGAYALAVAPNDRTLWVAAGTYEKSVLLLPVGAASGRLGDPIRLGRLGPLPGGLAISPDGRWAIVAHSGAIVIGNEPIGSTVTLVDLASRAARRPIKVGDAPVGVAFSPDSRLAYVSVNGSWTGHEPSLRVIDVASGRIVRTIPGEPSAIPGVAAASPLGTVVLVGNLQVDLGEPPPDISVVNLRSNREVAVRLPARFAGTSSIAFACDGSEAFAATEAGLVRISVRTRRATPVSGSHLLPFDLVGVAATPGGKHLWAATSFQEGCPSSCHGATLFMPLSAGSSSAGRPVSLPWSSELFAIGPAPPGSGHDGS